MPIAIHNHLIDKLAILVGFTSGVALYPQVWLILQTASIEQFSPMSFIIIFINSCVWLAYAMHRGLFSLAIPSTLNIIGSGLVLLKVGSLML